MKRDTKTPYLFSEEEHKTLETLRNLVYAYAIKNNCTVSANTVRILFPLIYGRLRVKVQGALFKDARFVPIGYVKSTIPKRKGGVIRVYECSQ